MLIEGQQAVEEQPVTQETQGDNGNNGVDYISKSDHETEIKKLIDSIEQVKRSQAGSDKMVADLKRENEELKKSKMSDKERAEYEKKLFDQERINLQNEKSKIERDKMIAEYFAQNQIKYDYKRHVNAEDLEGLKIELDHLKQLIDDERKDEREKIRGNETGTPAGGSKPFGGKSDLSKMTDMEFNKYVQSITDDNERQKMINNWTLLKAKQNRGE